MKIPEGKVAKLSLMQVTEDVAVGEMVIGQWLQDLTGTLETARQAAIDAEKLIGPYIKVIVVDEMCSRYNTLMTIRRA
jgi:hypothetical protein